MCNPRRPKSDPGFRTSPIMTPSPRSGTDPVAAYATDAQKFSLLESGVLDRPNCKLLVIDGMEDSIFPIEDNFIVGVSGDKKDLVVRGDRSHMGNPGAEAILYRWIDDAMAGKP
jgi:hypothetical protein